jgi:hypothetical protein
MPEAATKMLSTEPFPKGFVSLDNDDKNCEKKDDEGNPKRVLMNLDDDES